jgi:hypothetical protein
MRRQTIQGSCVRSLKVRWPAGALQRKSCVASASSFQQGFALGKSQHLVFLERAQL